MKFNVNPFNNYTLTWLLAGLFFVIYYAESNTKITSFLAVGAATLGFQLWKANHFWDSIFFSSRLLRVRFLFSPCFPLWLFCCEKKFISVIEYQENELNFGLQPSTDYAIY